MFRGAPRTRFSAFSSFGTPRKRIFQIFRVSGHPESLFSGILRLRDSPTVHFHKKQLVGASRNIVFLNFYLSGCPEAQFSSFFARRLQVKCCFRQFLMKKHERRAVFVIFRPSLASKTLFLAIFDEKKHERRTVFYVFHVSSADDEHFRQFLHFVGRRQAFFAVLYKFPVGEMQKILKTARREKNRTPKVISSNFRGSVHILIRTCSFIILYP